MEKVSWEDEIRNRKEAYLKGIGKFNEQRVINGDHPDYTKSRDLWKQFLKGSITAKQLGEHLGYIEHPKTKHIKELFGGKEI